MLAPACDFVSTIACMPDDKAAITAGVQSRDPQLFDASDFKLRMCERHSFDEVRRYHMALLTLADLEDIWRYTAKT